MSFQAWSGHFNLCCESFDQTFCWNTEDGSTKKLVVNSKQLPQASYMMHRDFLSAMYEWHMEVK
jgi:hypothetical protein